MAKKIKEASVSEVSLTSDNPVIRKPRLSKLIIKNFRCIGSIPVSIDLDEIVVLVGANNTGKSSILRAYEVVMSDGSKSGELSLDDFPMNIIDPLNLPQIELHTIVYDIKVGEQWLQKTNDGEWLVKEKWTWDAIGKGKRQGWDVTLNDGKGNWHPTSFPFGPANIANQRRPEPHSVSAFDSPEKQAEAIKKLLMDSLEKRVKTLKSANKDEENEYHQLLEKVKEIQKNIVNEAQEQIDEVNAELSKLINKVFPNYKIDFDAKPEDNLDKTINLFKAEVPQLLMGPSDGYLSTIEKQGSGARRTLLWTALKYISENNRKEKKNEIERPHLLLIDEPEICLHPNAIRDACNVLYDLPESENWQVMVTTHSPIFIDFSRDNTTIMKVERNSSGVVQGTTVFRPETTQLDVDDKRNLKLLNLCDPYVAEFFFGGKVIIVEGDTEYTAFNYIKAKDIERYKNIHIIRARGKATIVSLVKILNQFGTGYSILHDSDTPLIANGTKTNPAWSNNKKILEAVEMKPDKATTRLLASLPNFEKAFFGEEIKTEKPYNALKTIVEQADKFAIVETLFRALINHEAGIPKNCTEWSSIEELKEKLEATEH